MSMVMQHIKDIAILISKCPRNNPKMKTHCLFHKKPVCGWIFQISGCLKLWPVTKAELFRAVTTKKPHLMAKFFHSDFLFE